LTSPYVLTCTTGANVSMATSDRVAVFVNVYIPTATNHSVSGELDIEGTAWGNYDSRVTVPNPEPPTISSLNPTAGPVNWSVTIAGTNFGATQGSSTVKFNNTTAAPTSWSPTSITAPVPASAPIGPGPVVVTVNGADNTCPNSNCTFTVVPPPVLTAVTPSSAHINDAVTIAGNNFMDTQGSSTVTFNGTPGSPTAWGNTSITVPVPTGATNDNLMVTVSNQQSNALPFTVIIPGAIGGTITRATGGTGISGATVQAVLTGIVKGSATTAANGTYSIPNLDPANYDVRIFASGFSPELRQNIAVTSSATTTVNVAMSAPGAVSGTVTQVDGTTPIAGAAVTVFAGPVQKSSTNTNSLGGYTFGGLHPGAYTVQAANVGYTTSEQGATITESATTTKNFSLQGALSGPVLYAYDELGRLVQVTDPSGNSAIYRYDPVGNITAIDRPGSGGSNPVAISGFTPTSGLVGTTVTISGTGFSPTASQNDVTFNNIATAVTTATTTEIVTTVPAGATTGPIAVTSPSGSATSGTAFSVLAASVGPPTISGFTPSITTAGATLTVNGTNFDSTLGNNRMTANVAIAQVTSAGPTALLANLPATTTGRVSVATPAGTATSSTLLWVVPPPYAVADVDSTDTLSIATLTTVPINTANKIAMRVFEGTQGQRVSINVTDVNAGVTTVKIYDAYGNVLRSGNIASSGLVEPVTLPVSATYTVVADPVGSNTGSVKLTLYDVPPDITTPITFGSPLVVDLTSPPAPGRNARLTFSGTTDQRVSVKTTDTTSLFGAIRLLKPDGTLLGESSFQPNLTVSWTCLRCRYLEPTRC
jgi:YD repeat-containing protein